MDPTPKPAQERKPRLVRAPLVFVAVAMVLGIVAGRYLPLPQMACIIVGAAGTLAAAILALMAAVRKSDPPAATAPATTGEPAPAPAPATPAKSRLPFFAMAAVLLAVTALSALYAQCLYFAIPDDDLVNFTCDQSSLATIEGRIVTTPQIVSDSPDVPLSYKRPDHTVFVLECSAFHTAAGPRPAEGLVRVTIDEPARSLAAGQRVQVVCRIGRFGPPRNPGQFDPSVRAREKRTLTWASVPTAEGVTPLDDSAQSLAGPDLLATPLGGPPASRRPGRAARRQAGGRAHHRRAPQIAGAAEPGNGQGRRGPLPGHRGHSPGYFPGLLLLPLPPLRAEHAYLRNGGAGGAGDLHAPGPTLLAAAAIGDHGRRGGAGGHPRTPHLAAQRAGRRRGRPLAD